MNPLRTEVPPAILAMHIEFEKLSGAPLTLDFTRMDAWRVFLGFRSPPFTTADLRLVYRSIQTQIKVGRRNIGALKFRNLIQPDYFEEDLNAIKAMMRPRPPATRQIRVNGIARIVPSEGTEDRSVAVGSVIEAMRKAVG